MLRFFIVLIALLSTLIPLNSFAQAEIETSQSLQQLQSDDWQVRQDAAYILNQLPESMKTDQIKKALIEELEKEYIKINSGEYYKGSGDHGNEEDYYSWLFDVVSDFVDDRAFPIFVMIGSPTALIKYGEKGLDVIIEDFEKKDCFEGQAYIYVFNKWLKQKSESHVVSGKKQKEKIKKALLKGIDKFRDPPKVQENYEPKASMCATARINILKSLAIMAESGDQETTSKIMQIAKDDPYINSKNEPEQKYIVREEANKILEKLQNKGRD